MIRSPGRARIRLEGRGLIRPGPLGSARFRSRFCGDYERDFGSRSGAGSHEQCSRDDEGREFPIVSAGMSASQSQNSDDEQESLFFDGPLGERNGKMSEGEAKAESEKCEDDSSSESKVKGASLALGGLRDVALGAGLLSLFAAADSWAAITEGRLAQGLSVVDGLLVGAALGALCHEWGHFWGARISGSKTPLLPFSAFPQIFNLDLVKCEGSHFMGMSLGGNIGHWLLLVVLFLGLPLATSGQVALLSGSFGFCVFASSVEFPVILKAWTGASPLEALSVIPPNFVRRNGAWGLGAAVAAFLII